MMFLLPGDIIPHRFNLRKADGKNAVAVLPCEIMQSGIFCLQPERDEPRLISLTISATVPVRESVERRCT